MNRMTRPDRIAAFLLTLAAGTAVARADTLKATPIGKIADAQGLCALQPANAQRWTPVGAGTLLCPGDWVRTDPRGANAFLVRLSSRGRITVGPGSLLEVLGSNDVRLVRGEAQIASATNQAVSLRLPANPTRRIEGTRIVRVAGDRSVDLESEPDWLRYFQGTLTTEPIGSLMANVEGRNVPLTVGYHKVTVDIRDQIARTVIEESFVNRTDGRLEGVFHFPLPPDASISGFGMWIGEELVEADVVEKERAREIYETILREQRDPGLLEWTGGNIFKARVFPIFAHSEKRITITYTQVLPLRGSRYRYSYALQSELLKQHPLRELAIDVRIASALPLKSVKSATHTARTEQTRSAARVQFAAQEYAPDRDFEVDVEVDAAQAPVTVVPHRRGDDGYFLMLLNSPDSSGGWQRALVPDGRPMDLLILADTSASMDAASRKTRDQFVATLLSALGPGDTFSIAACDVTCDWFSEKRVAATEESVAAARDFLAARRSLGWTDLDRAFAAAFARTEPGSQILYVGDGIVTTGDADPVAFAKRLKRMAEGKPGIFHAIATSSSFEPVVLKAVASLGGGSFRRIEGADGPSAIAAQLLAELSRPTLRDLKVEFKGFRAARVYPAELPNLPEGSQQIVLGRYLPEGKDLAGEAIVTGAREGKAVEYRAAVSFKDAEQGNSFIPRLWARMHLDTLLDQGRSPEIKDEVIALSEDYQIITPYTSLLVLESDADRERFAVKRRFRMRDGEKFFAEGRDSAGFELAQKQMKLAGAWRLNLRREALRRIARMGRDADLLNPWASGNENTFGILPSGEWMYSVNGFCGAVSELGAAPRVARHRWNAGPGSTRGDSNGPYEDGSKDGWECDSPFGDRLAAPDPPAPVTAAPVASSGPVPSDRSVRLDSITEDESAFSDADGEFAEGEKRWEENAVLGFKASRVSKNKEYGSRVYNGRYGGGEGMAAERFSAAPFLARSPMLPGKPMKEFYARGGGGGLHGFQTLLPAPPRAPAVDPKRDTKWPAEAHALADALVRLGDLTASEGGTEVRTATEHFDALRNRVSGFSTQLGLISATSWLVRSGAGGAATQVSWCDGETLGAFALPVLLGRRLKAEPADLKHWPLGLMDHSLRSVERVYNAYAPTLEARGANQVSLRLKPASDSACEIRMLIDTDRRALVRLEYVGNGKTTSSLECSEFTQVGGRWWAQRMEGRDAEGRVTSRTALEVRTLNAADYQTRYRAELADRDRAILIGEPIPTVAEARQAIVDRKATFEAHLAMLADFALSQQWDKADEHLALLETLAKGKPGIRWLRDAVLLASRRHEELRIRTADAARELAQQPVDGDLCLADRLIQTSRQTGQHIETLPLLDVLKPVYERQDPRLFGPRQWRQRRAETLRWSGQAAEAFELQQPLAREFTFDLGIQREYLNALVERAEHDAAFRWIDELLTNKGPWQPYEQESLRSLYLQYLENQGRYSNAVAYVERQLADNPRSAIACPQYLADLFRSGQDAKARETMARWVAEASGDGDVDAQSATRLQAAVNLALGQGHNMYADYLDEQWLDLLTRAVRALARHRTQSQVASQIMTHWRFQQTDACRALRREFAALLTNRVAELQPAEIQRFVGWVWPNDPAVETETWKTLAKNIERRWSAETKPEARLQLAQTILQILAGRASPAERLAFLHRQWREAAEQDRSVHARQLFDALLEQTWSREYEDEAFSLLVKLSNSTNAAQRLVAQVQALYRLTDRMAQARHAAAMAAVEKKENRSRTELKALDAAHLRTAREELAERLGSEAERQDAPLRPWLQVERLYLESLLQRDPKAIAAECWEQAGAEPPASNPPLEWLDAVLLQRHVAMLEYLATRPKADPELGKRLLAYYEKGLAAEPEDATWRMARYRMLLALDRPDDMEQALRSWIRPGEADNTWRLMLGYLHAERNRIPEAIQQFEAIHATDGLAPADCRALANWYLVENDRRKHEDALVDSLAAEGEHRLAQRLYAERRRWERGQDSMPTELDPQVVRVLTALFRKSERPADHLWQLRNFYQYTRDFRLLECLAEGVIGHSAARVYPFLGQLRPVLDEIREEATADSTVAHVGKVRPRAKGAVDSRALDLLEVQVERRAAEVRNQPGPHVEAALAALKRAFKGEWTRGERALMAEVLAGLGAISAEPLATEQLRQLEVLYQGEAEGTLDRFRIACHWAAVLWARAKWDPAIDRLESALDEFRMASGGILPQTGHDAIETLARYLEERGQFARGEKLLRDELARTRNDEHKRRIALRLYGLFIAAVVRDGEVSLGRGPQLYKAAEKTLIGDLSTPDHNYRYSVVNTLCSLYRAAHDRKLSGVADDLKTFARQGVAAVLAAQTSNYQNIVSTVSDALHNVAGVRDALAFLVERIEAEPAWFRIGNQDGWRQFSWRIAQWRSHVKDLGDLDGRLLKIVTDALRQDLRTQRQVSRAMCERHSGYFWTEKAESFAQVAEDVLKERPASSAAAKYVTFYLYHGLDRFGRAIEALQDAHRRGILDESAQAQCVDFLHRQSRFAESIPILDPLVQRRPDNLSYRCQLMHAFFRTGAGERALTLLKETDAFFHAKGLWNEGTIAALAQSALQNQFYEPSVAYYREVIPLHQRTQPDRGIGNGTLSSYYTSLAQAHSGLKQTAEAVDAACGAIVSWGPRHDRRGEALNGLKEVLRRAPALDEFAAALDRQVRNSGLENPIVRKALGQVYLDRKEFARAVAQLRLAAAVQPNDAETHQALVAACDRQNDREGAIRQLLESVELSRRDLALYRDLGDRFAAIDQAREAERAYTATVEMLPNESESHTLLAEIRQRQNRWPEAIEQWRQVARVRSIEPTGHLKLAEALIHEKDWAAARETIKILDSRAWPTRFGDVRDQARRLLGQVEAAEKRP